MKRYYIKISGAAWDIKADTPEAAIADIKNYASLYCSFTALEIGVDCDKLGWPIQKGEVKPTHLTD